MGAAVLTLVVLVLGLTATLAAAAGRRDLAEEEFAARYGQARVAALRDLQAGVERYATVLRSAGAFITSSSDEVTNEEFTQYGRKLDLATNYPGMDAVGFIEPVAWDDRQAFADALAARGVVPEAPWEGPPHTLAVVVLRTNGGDGIGRDVAVDPVRREALERACDTGLVAMTGPVFRFADQELPAAERPVAVVMYAPLYEGAAPPHTPRDRRAQLAGWTGAVFRLDQLVDNLGIGANLVRIDLLVGNAESSLEHAPRSLVEQIDLYGQRWNVVFAPTPMLGEPGDDWKVVLWGGAGTTLGLAAIVALLATQRARLRREVDAAVAEAANVNSRLERDSNFQRALLDNLQVGVIVVDHRGKLRTYNLDTEGLYAGHLDARFAGSWSELLGLHTLTGDLLPEDQNPMLRVLAGERLRGVEVLVRPADGPEHVVSCNGQPIVDADGHMSGAVVAIHDISALKHAQRKLEQLARHDPLTGLPNRALLMERIDDALARAARRGTAVALLFLDLDGFKPVNDRFGHDVGDELLRSVAGRLRLASRTTDTVARLGGDEFVVLCEDLPASRDLGGLVERLEAALEATYELERGSEPVELGVSIGVAFAEDGDHATSFLRRADESMYASKAARRGNFGS
jgi:diguanylate cyclase (GGDEF)-like protein/PAS domain S-box-containing protein